MITPWSGTIDTTMGMLEKVRCMETTKRPFFDGKAFSSVGGHAHAVRVVLHLGQFQGCSMHLEILIDRRCMHRMNEMMDELSIIEGSLTIVAPLLSLMTSAGTNRTLNAKARRARMTTAPQKIEALLFFPPCFIFLPSRQAARNGLFRDAIVKHF